MFAYPIAFYFNYGIESNNNLLSYNYSNSVSNSSDSSTIEYACNSNNYPVTSEETHGTEIITTQYFYNN